VDTKLGRRGAERIVRDLMGALNLRDRTTLSRVSLHLEPGGQNGSTPVAVLEPGGERIELGLAAGGHYEITDRRTSPRAVS
jgi:hypothetical protein